MTFLQAHRFGPSQITSPRPPPFPRCYPHHHHLPLGSSRLTSLTLRPLMSAHSLDTTAQRPLLAPRTQAQRTETLITAEAVAVQGWAWGGWGICVCGCVFWYRRVSSRVSCGPKAQISEKGMNKVSAEKKGDVSLADKYLDQRPHSHQLSSYKRQ